MLIQLKAECSGELKFMLASVRSNVEKFSRVAVSQFNNLKISGNHVPPKPHEVHILMDTFLEWMNSAEASELHPIKLAAIAHYRLVHIHPFTDGNGRTSRLLMNTILMKFGFPPVVIQKQQRCVEIRKKLSNRLTLTFI